MTKGQGRRAFVAQLLRRLADKTGCDIGADVEERVPLFMEKVERRFQMRTRDVAELTIDPEPVLEKLERIDEAIGNLVLSIDNLPFQIRSHMRWGMWDTMTDREYEYHGLVKPPIDESMYVKSELLALQKKLSVAVQKGEGAVSKYRKRKWTNKGLISLMWAVDFEVSGTFFGNYKPQQLGNGNTVKSGTPYAEFIEGMAKVFNVEFSNIERNWEYMNECKDRMMDTDGSWKTLHQIEVKLSNETK